MRAHLWLSAAFVLVAACAPRASRGPSVGPTAPAATAVRDSLRGPWRIRNPDRPRDALLELHAELRSTVDTVVRTDSVASRTWLSWSVVPGTQPSRLVGMVRGFEVKAAGDSAWQSVAELGFPVTFAAHVAAPGDQPRFETPDPTACDARAAAVQTLRDAWVAPPQTVMLGSTWQDSTTYTICRDGVLLRASGTRRYLVDGAELHNDRLVLRVLRSADTQVTGRGVQFGDSVQVTGHSTSQGFLLLTLDGGAVISGRIRSEFRLELRGRRRTQQLVQDGVLEIRAPERAP